MRSAQPSPVRISLLAVVTLTAATLAMVASPPPSAADGNEAPTAPAVRALSAGNTHTCVLFSSGALKCFGDNYYGQLGLGDTNDRGDDAGEMGESLPVVNLGWGRAVTAVSAGYQHTCAILDDGAVKCWGAGGNGRLGLGDTQNRGELPGEMGGRLPAVALGTGRTAVAISAGQGHTCAILDDGSLKCWGYNVNGQLGLGDTNDRGDAAGEMGDALTAVSLGAGRTAVAVSAGYAHTCALLDNSTVKCWGSGTNGRLGTGSTSHVGDGPGEMGDALTAVSLGTGRTAQAVTAGAAHTCALLDDGTAKCWGIGLSGRLGTGATNSRGDVPGEMGDALPAVPLGDGRTATSVSTGYNHTCVRLDDATVKCWGGNESGKLGQGSTTAKGDNPNELGNALPPISLGTGRTAVAVTTGDKHTCVRLDDGTVKCFGGNVDGQLGQGDTDSRGNEPGELGDNLPAIDLGTGLVPTLRPDARIRVGAGANVGNDTYNTTGDGQTVTANVRLYQPITVTLMFQNDGTVVDDLIVQGDGSTSAFGLKFLEGSTNVTSAVTAGTYRFDDVRPGHVRRLTVQVRARSRSPVGITTTFRFKVTSGTAHKFRDVVRLTASRT